MNANADLDTEAEPNIVNFMQTWLMNAFLYFEVF